MLTGTFSHTYTKGDIKQFLLTGSSQGATTISPGDNDDAPSMPEDSSWGNIKHIHGEKHTHTHTLKMISCLPDYMVV